MVTTLVEWTLVEQMTQQRSDCGKICETEG